MHAIDTNVWIYSYDERDQHKKRIALDVIAITRPLALPWQVGCEFVAASRKLSASGFTEEQAWSGLDAMRGMADCILLPTVDQWDKCREVQLRYKISYWDSMLAASCILAGVKTLYSEDFGGSDEIEGMEIINPFKPEPR